MTLAFKHVLVPVDFGDSSQRVLDAAIELAGRFDAALTLVHVYEVPAYVYGGMTYATADMFAPVEEAARKQLELTLKEVQQRAAGAKAVLRRGTASDGILACVQELRADLIVMGTHGRRGVSHLMLGSVAEKIVRLSPVPVLTLRLPAAG
jgi:nucleotide-binding universal stress UspA family protein